MSAPPELGDKLAATLAEHGPTSGSSLARQLRVRKGDTLLALHADRRFELIGRGSSSVWRLADSHQYGNRLGTSLEPLYGHANVDGTNELLDRVTALEKRLEALEHANGIQSG
jgi:hypothetical protein